MCCYCFCSVKKSQAAQHLPDALRSSCAQSSHFVLGHQHLDCFFLSSSMRRLHTEITYSCKRLCRCVFLWKELFYETEKETFFLCCSTGWVIYYESIRIYSFQTDKMRAPLESHKAGGSFATVVAWLNLFWQSWERSLHVMFTMREQINNCPEFF